MQNLVPIGRFAELTGLTVKALRLYDRLGVLRPALVDFPSGYRYYGLDQVMVARRIRLLRSLDMPLAEIRTMLTTDDADGVRDCLERHRRRIADRIASYQRDLRLLPTVDEWCDRGRKDGSMDGENKQYRCSFCGKDNAEVRRMIAGPRGVFICDECVSKCTELIAREEESARA